MRHMEESEEEKRALAALGLTEGISVIIDLNDQDQPEDIAYPKRLIIKIDDNGNRFLLLD